MSVLAILAGGTCGGLIAWFCFLRPFAEWMTRREDRKEGYVPEPMRKSDWVLLPLGGVIILYGITQMGSGT